MESLSKQVKKIKTAPDWYKTSFPAQIKFIEDPARFKTGLCTRRAGKSYGAGIYLFKTAYETPNITCLYIAKTRDSARNIMWKDILKQIDRDFNLGAKFQEANLRVILPNGSEIMLVGVDSNQDDMEKLRGQRLKLAVLDEGSTYRINVFQLVKKIIQPALWDFQGTLAMIGTPTDFVKSYFALASSGEMRGWSNHFWTADDNPHIREQYHEDYQEELAKDPNVESKAWFQQEYMGKWVVSEENRIFLFGDGINNIPKYKGGLQYNLGLSVGTTTTGITIVGHTTKLREALIVKNITLLTTDITRILSKLRRLEKEYGEFNYIVMDGVTPKLIDEIGSRFDISTPDE